MFGRIALYGTLLASAFAFVFILFSLEYERMITGSLPATVASLPTLTTDTWGIFDPKTGEMLQAQNEERIQPIASITKLFTANAVMESDKKDRTFSITWADIETEGRSKLAAGDMMSPYELLFPLLIESSNDAAEAIRRSLGSDFTNSVASLTSTVPLTKTVLGDASGLSATNVSTVRELAAFYAYLKRTHPHVLDISRLRMYITEEVGYVNNNPARNILSFTGGKNGYTIAAGKTFIGTFKENGREVGIVILGSSDISADIERLLSFAAPDIMTQ